MAPAQAKAGTNWSHKLKFYIVVMGGYYAYKYYKNQGNDPATAAKGGSKGTASVAEYDCKDGSEHVHRQFVKVGTSWVSTLQAGACSDNQLLLLHRTGLSAETEFGATIPQLIEKATPSGGLQIVAPDQPCHGFTPCPGEADNGEELSSNMLGRLVARRPGAQQFAYLASGRDSTQEALAIVKRRNAPARMLLFRPLMVNPDTKGITAPAGIDSARWDVLGHSPASKQDSPKPLAVAKMPRGCVVTLMYLDGDKEDDALKAALEEADVAVDVRIVDSMEEGIVPAVTDMLATDGAESAMDTETNDEEL